MRYNQKRMAPALMALLLILLTADLRAGRVELVLSDGWRFTKGEQSENVQQPSYDDANWEAVTVPHDWAIAGPFNPSESGYAGKLPWRGVGWYRKTIELPNEYQASQVYLDFDGVMAFPEVYVNGQLAGRWDYGYMSFRVDATPFVKL
jgi:beta-galactosidase